MAMLTTVCYEEFSTLYSRISIFSASGNDCLQKETFEFLFTHSQLLSPNFPLKASLNLNKTSTKPLARRGRLAPRGRFQLNVFSLPFSLQCR